MTLNNFLLSNSDVHTYTRFHSSTTVPWMLNNIVNTSKLITIRKENYRM